MKNEMIDLERFERMIRSKSFAELTNEEKEWISQWVASSEEYESLRASEIEVRQYFQNSNITLNPETLNQLKKHVREKKRVSKDLFWNLKPSLGALLMSFLMGGIGWWIGISSDDKPEIKPTSTLVVYDTIYVASKPDTIYSEKIVYKDRTVIPTNNLPVSDVSMPFEKNGISMKEKEDLEKLLVSGRE